MRLLVDVSCPSGGLCASLKALLFETDDGRIERICALETFRFFDHYGSQHEWTETEAHAWVVNGEVLVRLTSENEWYRRSREGTWTACTSAERASLEEQVRFVPPACPPASIGQAQERAFSAIACRLEVREGVLGGCTPGGRFVAVGPVAQFPSRPRVALTVMFEGAVLQVGEQWFHQPLGSERFEPVADPARLSASCRDREPAYDGSLPVPR